MDEEKLASTRDEGKGGKRKCQPLCLDVILVTGMLSLKTDPCSMVQGSCWHQQLVCMCISLLPYHYGNKWQ